MGLDSTEWALYTLRRGFPGLSPMAKYFLIQVILRYEDRWCGATVAELQRQLGMPRGDITNARRELLNYKFRGGKGLLEEGSFPGLSRTDSDRLRGRPRKGCRLSQSFLAELAYQSEGEGPVPGRLIFKQILLGAGTEDLDAPYPVGRNENQEYRLSPTARFVLAALWACAELGGVVTDASVQRLGRLSQLTFSTIRYQLGRLMRLGYIVIATDGVEVSNDLKGLAPLMVLDPFHKAYGVAAGEVQKICINAGPLLDLCAVLSALPLKPAQREQEELEARIASDLVVCREWFSLEGAEMRALVCNIAGGGGGARDWPVIPKQHLGALLCKYVLGALHANIEGVMSLKLERFDHLLNDIREGFVGNLGLADGLEDERGGEVLAIWVGFRVLLMARSLVSTLAEAIQESGQIEVVAEALGRSSLRFMEGSMFVDFIKRRATRQG